MNSLQLKNPDLFARALVLFSQGKTIRVVAQELHIARETAHRIQKQFIEITAGAGGELPKCECGRLLNHAGWCSLKVARSPQRQAMVRGWHQKKRGENDTSPRSGFIPEFVDYLLSK